MRVVYHLFLGILFLEVALGVFRDLVRSTKKKVVYASGVRWLTMALVIPVPWAKR